MPSLVSPAAWPGTRALATSPLADDGLLNLDRCLGQRQATWTFALSDGVSGQHLGELHPVRQPAEISHDTSRVIKRNLRLALTASDVAAVDPVRDRVDVAMHLAGRSYPLGRYMFTDPTNLVDTGGDQGIYTLLDEMLRVDQKLEHGFASTRPVHEAVRSLVAGLGLSRVDVAATEFPTVGGWAAGTTRGQVLAALALQGDYETPWMGNDRSFRMVRTIDPDQSPATLDLDTGARVLRASVSTTSDLLTAPNRFVVIANSGAADEAEIVGVYDVPPNAPHSAVNRGFVVPEVLNAQLDTGQQATAMARSLGLRQTVFERADLATPPDPRHDSYDVLRWDGRNWLELAWTMTCEEGTQMRHSLRRALLR